MPVPRVLKFEVEWFNSATNEYNKGEVILKKLLWGEYATVLRDSGLSQYKMIGQTPSLSAEITQFMTLLVLKSIVAAPFPHNSVDDIRALDPEVVTFLSSKATEINPPPL